MSLDGADIASPVASDVEQLLFVWLSPSFPVGAFAYSHGLEMAAERGLIASRPTLETWLRALVEHGSVHNDLLLLAAAHRAGNTDPQALIAANALALALQPSAERYLETTQQGRSFIDAVGTAWPHPRLEQARNIFPGLIAYPIAVAVASASHGVALPATLRTYATAVVTNLTSAAIRLGIVGQTDAQRVIAAMMPSLHEAAVTAAAGTLDDIGGCTFSSDLCSIEHETQYTRLFRS